MDASVTVVVVTIPSAAVVASTWLFCRTIRRMNWAIFTQGDHVEGEAASEAEIAKFQEEEFVAPAPDGQHTYDEIEQMF